METFEKIPQNAITLLRICTKKSQIQFGKYAGLTVGDIICIDVTYIAYLYYRVDNFSLREDVILELSLLPIDKPGTSDEKFSEWKKKYAEQFTDEQKQHGRWLFNVRSKKQKIANKCRVERETHFTKGQLQSINHGRWSGKK